MKKHITFIMLALLGLCGCTQTDELSMEDLAHNQIIFSVTPQRFTVAKEGETFNLRVSAPDTMIWDGVVFNLKNEVFYDTFNPVYYDPAHLPDLKLEARRQIDDMNVEYTFTVGANPLKEERRIGYFILDTTSVLWPSIAGRGYFILIQPGK